MFNIGVLDQSFEGILWVYFNYKHSDFKFNVCVCVICLQKILPVKWIKMYFSIH